MTTSTMPAPAPTSAWMMYRSLVGVGLVCGLLIVSAFRFTEPIIRANKIAARERAVLAVLPGAVTSRTFLMGDDDKVVSTSPETEGGKLVFAGYDPDGQLVGLAVEAQATGYQDVVRLVYGYAPDRQAVIGFRVLDSRETPGLGDRVETDPQYRSNFDALDVTLNEAKTALVHEIEIVKPGQKTQPWQVDTITGATITSSTVARMVRDSTAWWVPRLVANLEVFRAEAGR